MKELLSSIEYIHKMSIIHRDLKPENLILSDNSDDSHVKIADFGLATIASSELEHLKCGSPGYVGK
jgi:serine/threonine protein kinase